jgi:hypothetical protein
VDELNCQITFENCLPNEARSAAQDLETKLFQAFPDIAVDWELGNPRAQDMGTFLNILLPILGTPTVVVFANTLKDWLKRRKDVTVTLRNGKREIILQNITYKEAEQIFPQLAQLAFPQSQHNEGGEKHAESAE